MKSPSAEWISLDVEITPKLMEIGMDYALNLGASAILEAESSFQVSYENSETGRKASKDLKQYLQHLDSNVAIQETRVQRENWNKNWQTHFQPVAISDKLVILPEWVATENYDQRIKTRIRPAMAFGTGTHETTRLCLELLEDVIRAGDHVLDLGTGSGILGITALLLGAADVDGVDVDPLVEENVKENLRLNGISERFRLQISENPVLSPAYDVLLVNMVRSRLLGILPEYFKSVRRGGRVILSGLLVEEDAEFRRHLNETSWYVLESRTKNEWMAYLCDVH